MSLLPIFSAVAGAAIGTTVGWIAGPVAVHVMARTKIGRSFASVAEKSNQGVPLSEGEENEMGIKVGIVTGALIGACAGYVIGS